MPSLLKPAFADKKHSKFLVQKKLQEYFDFGGALLSSSQHAVQHLRVLHLCLTAICKCLGVHRSNTLSAQ